MIKSILRYANLPGFMVCKLPVFKRYKHRLLGTCHHPAARGFVDKMFFPAVYSFWLRFEYLSEQDPNEREAIKELAIGGDSGSEWAKMYDLDPLDINPEMPLFQALNDICSRQESVTVIQIGSSSGREIAWLSKKYPQHTYIGTDIYDSVVQYASEHHQSGNLRFLKYSALTITDLIQRHKQHPIVVFSSGSLQYVQPEHLNIFFKSIAVMPSLQIVVYEPADNRNGDLLILQKSLWRGNLSWTHNYRYFGESSGLRTVKCDARSIYVPGKSPRCHRHTVDYLYVGASIHHG